MAIAPFAINRIPARAFTVTTAAQPALVAHLQTAGINATPVTVTRREVRPAAGGSAQYAYDVITGHEIVAAAQAAGCDFIWCLVVLDAEAAHAEQSAIAAAPAAPAAPVAAPEAPAAPDAPEAPAAAETVGTATVAAESGLSRSALNAWARTHGAGAIRRTASGDWRLVGKAGRTWQWARA